MFTKIKKKLSGDSGKIFISNLLISSMNFFITIILIRLLGQSEFGKFVIISNFVLMAQVFIGLKSGEAILNFIKNDKDELTNSVILKQIILIDILMNLILYIFTLTFGYFYLKSVNIDYNLLLVFSFSILTAICLSVFENLYLIKDKLVKFHYLKLISTIIHITLVILGGYFYNIYGVLFAFIFSYLIRTIIFLFNLKDTIINSLKVKLNLFNKDEFNKFFGFFKHSYLSTTFKSGSQGLDIFLLSIVLSVDKIALYEAAKKLTQIPGLLFGSIWMAKSKQILEYGRSSNYNSLIKLIFSVYKIFIPLGIFISILFYIFSSSILKLMYGSNFEEASLISIIFFVSFWFINLIGGFGRIYFISINKLNILTCMNAFVFFGILILGYLYTKSSIFYMAILLCTLLLLNSIFLFMYIFLKDKYVK